MITNLLIDIIEHDLYWSVRLVDVPTEGTFFIGDSEFTVEWIENGMIQLYDETNQEGDIVCCIKGDWFDVNKTGEEIAKDLNKNIEQERFFYVVQ